MVRFVPKQLAALMGRFRYPILVLLVGLGLMLLPDGEVDRTEPVAETVRQGDLASDLESILGQISGAGRVRVLLTMESGREVRFQTDVDDTRQDTVVVEGADRTEMGLVRQTLEPEYRGAIVACQGADNAAVRLAIVEAVACVTGLGADRISVQKLEYWEELP